MSIKKLKSKSDPSLVDLDKVPEEISTFGNARDINEVLALSPGENIEFAYGEYVPNAVSFNQYLEANVRPGDTLTLERNSCLTMIKRLSDSLNTGGLSALPQICLGKECPRYGTCTIQQAGIPVPVGKPCALEKTEILNHVRKLAADFGEHRSYADQLLIQAVSGLEVLKSRAMAHLSIDSAVVVDAIKGVDNQGNIVKAKEANPAFEVINKLTKNELALLKALSLTAADRLKREENKALSSDAQAASYRKKLSELKAQQDRFRDQGIQDAVFTVLEEVEVSDNAGEDLDGLDSSSTIVSKAKDIENKVNISNESNNRKIYSQSNEGREENTGRGIPQTKGSSDAGDQSEGLGVVGEKAEDTTSYEREGSFDARKYKHAPGESPFLRRREGNEKPESEGDDSGLEEVH